MGNFDFSLVNKKQKKEIEYVYEDREQIKKELDKLNQRHDEILKLSGSEFLSDEIQAELDYIHKRTLALVKTVLRIGL